jgi:benzoyl-CoA reductase subunit B
MTHSKNQLEATRAAEEYQKAWFAEIRNRVFEKRQPYAIVQADMPLELFEVMDVPVISNQWWAALVAAKQLSGYYFDRLSQLGFSEELCRYCSLGLATTLSGESERAPWGGLPKPALLSARLTCDCIQRVFGLWAEAFGALFLPLENPGATKLPPRWWELSRHRWNELFEEERLDLMVAEFRALIAKLEAITGRRFDVARLRSLMEAVNQQEEYYDEVRRLICRAPRSPLPLIEQIKNVMIAQWHRGGDWAVAHARAFRDEVARRVEQGIAACPNERVRLMWVGAGLWYDTGFYTAFEASYGATFVWSMYLAFGPDGYIRYGLADPLRALASRIVSLNEQLHNPPWANEWIADQAKQHRIDAAVMLLPLGTRSSQTGTRFIEQALKEAGVPTLVLAADMVDARQWNPKEARACVARFLEEQR